MADFNKPTIDSNYTQFPDEIKAAISAALSFLDGGMHTNIPLKAKRWNPTNKIFEEYNGTQWVPMATEYNLPVNYDSLTNKPEPSSSVTNNSETTFANTKAVKTAYDKAVEAKELAELAKKSANNVIDSPALTGTPTAPTASQETNNTQIATTAFVKAAIAALVGSAPASLDTLNELATALNNNANFAATIVNQLSQKADKNILDALVGIPLPWMQVSLPEIEGVKILAMNGQRFDKHRYPILAQRYPSGVLIDLRSEFIRGWDNGRNIDRDRQILSAQGDAIRNITGELKSVFGGYRYALYTNGTGAFESKGRAADYTYKAAGSNGEKDTILFDASKVVPTAPDNRPRNVAFQYICIAA